MEESRTKKATRNIVFGVISNVVNMLLPFVTRTMIIYLIGTVYLGVSTLFGSILNYLNLAELGLGGAIVYMMYKPIAANDIPTINALLNYYKRFYRL